MKSHLKRHSAPKTWPLLRKEQTFIIRPYPSGHRRALSLPLTLALRDSLHLARTSKEANLALREKMVLVDGKPRLNGRHSVGLFDVLSLPSMSKDFRLVLDNKGNLKLVDIDTKESKKKICKVIRKSMVKNGKVQITLHDGRNILGGENAKVGDSVELSLPEGKITSILSFQPGVKVVLTRGRHAGKLGTVKEISGPSLTFESADKKEVQTLKDYAIVVGETKEILKVTYE